MGTSHGCATPMAAPEVLLSPGVAVRQASEICALDIGRLRCSNTANDGGDHCSAL